MQQVPGTFELCSVCGTPYAAGTTCDHITEPTHGQRLAALVPAAVQHGQRIAALEAEVKELRTLVAALVDLNYIYGRIGRT